MLGFLLLIVINLTVGYALALCLHRPDLLPAAVRERFPAFALPTLTSAAAMPNVASASLVQNFPAANTNMTKPFPSPTADPALSTTITPLDSPRAKPASQQPSSAPQTGAAEHAVVKFQDDLQGYRDNLNTLNEQVRQQSAEPNPRNVQGFVTQFDQLTDHYLQRQEERLQSLQGNSASADPAWAQPCLAAAQHQAAAIESTRETLSGTGELADAAAACRQFLLATGNLASANQSLQEELDRTLNRVRAMPPTAGNESLISSEASAPEAGAEAPEVMSSDNLERAVAEFIELQAEGAQKFSVALVEIDQLATINAQHGQAVSNRILQAIEQTFISLTPRSTLAKDSQRQQLLYFQLDVAVRDATRGVEQVRQRIAAANFQHDENRVLVTISCGVAEAIGEEQPQDIVARLLAMLREAQRYGRNCTFFQEGKHSAPAIPPTVVVEARVIEV
ncbi:MAG TPA: diguanylate cyclase [Pirellulales bacterium]|nr:diguanylate cyclase [Pirellulales bacterium]